VLRSSGIWGWKLQGFWNIEVPNTVKTKTIIFSKVIDFQSNYTALHPRSHNLHNYVFRISSVSCHFRNCPVQMVYQALYKRVGYSYGVVVQHTFWKMKAGIWLPVENILKLPRSSEHELPVMCSVTSEINYAVNTKHVTNWPPLEYVL